MSSLIEYLTADEYFSFTADTSKDLVIAKGPNPQQAKLINGNGQGVFTAGDSLIVLSYGVMLPENFTFFMQSGTGLPILVLWGKALAVSPFFFNLPIFPGTAFGSSLNVIEENREMEIDGFCSYGEMKGNTGAIKDNYSLNVNFSCEVSMLNVPVAANGKTYYVVPFLKVAHNIALQ
jgi:hypothetical protein